MRNLLWTSLRSASAVFASSALHCNSPHSSDNDSDVRTRHMGQVISDKHGQALRALTYCSAAVAAVVSSLERR
jgi:hypothetical protein